MEARIESIRRAEYPESAEEEPQRPSILWSARRRWPIVLIVAIATFAGAYWYAEQLPSSYSATTVVALSPRPGAAAAGTGAVTLAGAKYVAYTESARTASDVAALVGQSASDVQDAVSAVVQTNTGNVEISATWRDPTTAADIANRFGRQLVKQTGHDPLVIGEAVSRAVPPSSPSGPPRRAMEAASVAVGVALGFGLAVALERARPRVTTRSDLERLAGPVLAEFPRNRRLRRRPRTAFAEPSVGTPARHLRTNVDVLLRRQRAVVCVTSPMRNDGKSSIAALVAEAFARKGTRTLLIDADVHGSRVADVFGVKRTGSISGVVKGDPPLREAVQPGWTKGLFVLAPARASDDGDVIANSFESLLARTRVEAYPMTIVDLPPLIGVDDARVVATMSDGVVLVVSAGASPSVIQEAVEVLDMIGAPYLGVVANRWKVRPKSYYYT